ncbi:protoporphyrinogen oxidase [Vitiosangium sp. GDMCC 1.1324]|uniref:protoporphyrinogen oxidase n=1 Tax=Vitiosangium sp. (strain GDMCC 1.1324) TaxID=2138576 RepID=UPI000D3A4C2F|nr:protoporphyrinogen oxidase [Vitiosangium sp. GDMCC 1.1324]PTL77559.1 protoporphyrinogen oxidase [Vitiosangium sp. GDMCC 1.1324]
MSVIVIGGGLSGMAVAFHMQQRGVPVVLLERMPRLGGNIQTYVRDGFFLENGPNSFFDREPAMRALARGLGVEDLIQPATGAARKRYVYTRGRLRASTRTASTIFGSELLPLGSRLLGELFSFGGEREPLSVSTVLPELEEQEQPTRTSESRANPVEPLTGELSSFRGGLQRLVDALARRLGTSAHTHAHVERLTPVPGGGWRVGVRTNGEHTELEASQVAVCTPAHTAARILSELDPELGNLLEGITYAPMAVVHMGFAPESVPRPNGAGFLVPSNEKRRLLGASHSSTLFPWRAEGERVLYTCMVGGTRQPELASLPAEELIALVREELADIAGVRAEPVVTDVVRWPCALPLYTADHAERLAALDQAVARWPGLHLTGNAYRGISMVDCVRNAAVLAEQLTRHARATSPGASIGIGSQQPD